jgi:hypothetical protein
MGRSNAPSGGHTHLTRPSPPASAGGEGSKAPNITPVRACGGWARRVGYAPTRVREAIARSVSVM